MFLKSTFTWIDNYRFNLLLVATLLVLFVPAFVKNTFLSDILFVVSMSFLLIQSMITITPLNSKITPLRYVFLSFTIVVIWLEKIGLQVFYYKEFKLSFLIVFFVYIIVALGRFVYNSTTVNRNVLVTTIVIYLLIGIVIANLAFLMHFIFPNGYSFPQTIIEAEFVDFLYFGFVTMTTVGYGDIVPTCNETQTLTYLSAVVGQLYVAIVVAMIVGKYIVSNSNEKTH